MVTPIDNAVAVRIASQAAEQPKVWSLTNDFRWAIWNIRLPSDICGSIIQQSTAAVFVFLLNCWSVSTVPLPETGILTRLHQSPWSNPIHAGLKAEPTATSPSTILV
ncbi:hypothetical protein [Rhizobium mayense]|uniref:Uncharacterized protein n=1 Tax=Rhizobium mayense TaxID=1312184 RepID=A0ABT7K190_9HYPH|nr:hypothetical protein [Rhizobium mayense]MDL2402375.1 hypothetical protein [Rhizobium mayense]